MLSQILEKNQKKKKHRRDQETNSNNEASEHLLFKLTEPNINHSKYNDNEEIK